MDQLLAMKVFAKVAERGSFAQAADELDISRAAASGHVASLEKHLGARLLNRTTRRVGLTAGGSDSRGDRHLQARQDAAEHALPVVQLHLQVRFVGVADLQASVAEALLESASQEMRFLLGQGEVHLHLPPGGGLATPPRPARRAPSVLLLTNM